MAITVGEEVTLTPGTVSGVSTSVTQLPQFPDVEVDMVECCAPDGVDVAGKRSLVASVLPLFMAAFLLLVITVDTKGFSAASFFFVEGECPLPCVDPDDTLLVRTVALSDLVTVSFPSSSDTSPFSTTPASSVSVDADSLDNVVDLSDSLFSVLACTSRKSFFRCTNSLRE